MRRFHFHLIQVLIDTILMSASLILAVAIRYEASIPVYYAGFIIRTLPVFVLTKLIVFFLMGMYGHIWRYTSTRELFTIIKSTLISSSLILIVLYYIQLIQPPRSIFIIDWLLTVIFIGGIRFFVRLFYERKAKRSSLIKETKPVLIVGAGDSGEIIAREMLKSSSVSYTPVGFIDDDPTKQGLQIHGIKVLGTTQDLPDLLEKLEVEEVIIAIATAPSRLINEIAQECAKKRIECKTVPGIYELISGSVSLNQIRDIQIEDILGRNPVKVNLKKIAEHLSGRTVMVTGAGGSIGSELCRQLSFLDPQKLVMLDKSENNLFCITQEISANRSDITLVSLVGDVQDRLRMEEIFSEHKPEIIYHAAAYKHVPLMEGNPREAIKNNLIGTKTLADCALKHHVGEFILVSTDKAVKPVNIMGVSKFLAEKLICTYAQRKKTKFIIVRFGNVLGSNGSVVPIFKDQIAKGGPLTVTHAEMTRYFMTISEAVQLILQAGTMGKGGEIYILDMGEPVKIVDLAKNIIKLSGFEPDIDIQIDFTGIRPGEKLTEQLHLESEQLQNTSHLKIFVVENSHRTKDNWLKEVEELEKLVYEEPRKLNRKVTELVPTYRPGNI